MQLSFDKRDLAESIEHGLCMAFLWAVKLAAWSVVIMWVISASPWWRDATDEPGWFGTRSGMGLHTDQETGCQYLSNDGLIPRVDGRGRHLGCYESPDHGP